MMTIFIFGRTDPLSLCTHNLFPQHQDPLNPRQFGYMRMPVAFKTMFTKKSSSSSNTIQCSNPQKSLSTHTAKMWRNACQPCTFYTIKPNCSVLKINNNYISYYPCRYVWCCLFSFCFNVYNWKGECCDCSAPELDC